MTALPLLPGAPLDAPLGKPNFVAILAFFAFVALALVITWVAARRSRTLVEYYAAGRPVSAGQTALALAGDYMSAASILGVSGLVALYGYDGMIYATGWLVGWPALLFLIAEPLRNLGRFTFADVVAFRLQQTPVRIAAAFGSIATVLLYSVAQMVGAGSLVSFLFGIPYGLAELIVGTVMVGLVLYGGTMGTTWVQVTKAVLLLFGVTVLTVLVLARFHFDPVALYAAVAKEYGQAALEPGGFVASPVEGFSLGLALMFGLLGLPHVLLRFYTVPDARTARKAALYATGLVGYFYLLIPLVGFGAAALVGREVIAAADPGGNMAAPLVAELLAGMPFLGFIAAVTFATILAVVSGLTLAGASAYAHDIYVNVLKRGRATEQEQVRAAKGATLALGALAVAMGILYQGQNVAFMVGLAFSIAASANFPALLLSLVWKRFTTAGAVWSIATGALLSVSILTLGPTIWGGVLRHLDASGQPLGIVPLENPAIVSMPAAFLVGIVVSLLRQEPRAQELYEQAKLRLYLGVGADERDR